MHTLQATAVVSTLVLISGCGDHHDGGQSPAAESHAAESQSAGPHAVEPHAQETGVDSPGLRLNGTQKWQMDEHTRAMYGTMVARIADRDAEDLASKQLGQELDKDLDALVQGCTMTGDAHRELHKFLGAYIPAVQALAAEGGEDAALEVQRLLELYPRYFE